MGKAWQTVIVLLGVWAVVQALSNTPVEAQLDTFFYLDTCPQVYGLVAKGVYAAIKNETRTAAFLLRLPFHDCFVQGCDASILLDSTENITSEQFSPPNKDSISQRAYDLINSIKVDIESSCPGVVSCADIIQLGGFFSVILSRGPTWLVQLGRRDSFEAQPFNQSNGSPLPNAFQNITALQAKFAAQNLTNKDLVALSGAHTIGNGRCVSFSPQRLYNFTSDPSGPDPSLNTTLLGSLQTLCPFGGDGNVTTVMDLVTPTVFDNQYFQGLVEGNGLFETDQELFTSDNDTQSLVELYASDQETFFEDFTKGMINMGNANVSTGTEGEIRLNCSVRNPVSSFKDEKVDWEKTETKEKTVYHTLERTESAQKFFKQVLKLVAEEIELERLAGEAERLVEESVTWGHSSM